MPKNIEMKSEDSYLNMYKKYQQNHSKKLFNAENDS
jgi:hypothetical protein